MLPLLGSTSGEARGQLVFSGPANFGGTTGIGLFEQRNGQVVQLATGQTSHFFPWISRSGQFISFSAPDPTVFGANPSSDVYVYNRANGQTSRVINNETFVGPGGGSVAVRAISSAVSPGAAFLAYGVAFQSSDGAGGNASGKGLRVVQLSNGLDAGQPLVLGDTPSDSLQAEFIGISWDPQGISFVTPTYVLVGTLGGFPQNLPAIVRWTLLTNGSWSPTQLSNPQYFNNFTAARFHIYPAISPSGAGLAYFSIFVPDLFTGSQPAEVSLIRANADGSNAAVLGTFTPTPTSTFYPAGLDWSQDGTRLIFSLGRQSNSGFGFTTSVDLATAQTHSIGSANGDGFQRVPGLEGAFFPSAGPNSGGSSPSLEGVRLSLSRTGSDSFTLSATGLNPSETYELRSSTTFAAGSFRIVRGPGDLHRKPVAGRDQCNQRYPTALLPTLGAVRRRTFGAASEALC
ncbi:hypothetical protein BH23VER1_BH23VER1_20720 [soil metagenome]